MDEMTRRGALTAAAAGAMALASANAEMDDEKEKSKSGVTEQDRALDRERLLASGLTPAEAEVWDLAGQCAEKFFALPKLHVMDDHEIAHAVHVVQYRVLARPAYRKYLELARKGKK